MKAAVRRVVVFSGAGISAPSGLSTFRDPDGIWNRYRIDEVATPEAWARDPDKVLRFYNDRRAQLFRVQPNAAHRAVAALEDRFDVVVITQNIDNLHERAGSSRVIHLHGELSKARSTADADLVYEIGDAPIRPEDRCARGSPLRPHVVWFGEDTLRFDEAAAHVAACDILIVVGTSLAVYPAAGLTALAPDHAEKYVVNLRVGDMPKGFDVLEGSADLVLPDLCDRLRERP